TYRVWYFGSAEVPDSDPEGNEGTSRPGNCARPAAPAGQPAAHDSRWRADHREHLDSHRHRSTAEPFRRPRRQHGRRTPALSSECHGSRSGLTRGTVWLSPNFGTSELTDFGST